MTSKIALSVFRYHTEGNKDMMCVFTKHIRLWRCVLSEWINAYHTCLHGCKLWMCVNIQCFVHRVYTFWRTRFALSHFILTHRHTFFAHGVWFLCSAVKGCLFVIALPTHMSVRMRCRILSVDCDDAYSYGDNFIYLYSHYDLSMWCYNKACNECSFTLEFREKHLAWSSRCTIFLGVCRWIL